MRQSEFEASLRQAMHRPPGMGPQRKLAQTCLLAGNELKRRRRREHISFPQLLFRQIRYVGWRVWSGQGLLLAALVWSITRAYGEFFWESPQALVRVLFCASVLTGMTALPILYHAVRWRMQEVEAAAYFSSVRLLMAKLAVVGMGDGVLLAGIFGAAMVRTTLQAGCVSFYLCVPFLAVSSAVLFLLGHVSCRRFFAGSMGVCVLLLVLGVTAPGRCLVLFQQTFSGSWLVVCGALLIFCAYQARYLLYRAPYLELQVGY